MKLFRLVLLCSAIQHSGSMLQAQATFQNLNFEATQVPDIPAGQSGGFVAIAQGLPGWKGYEGTNEITQVLHNNETAGGASISILGQSWDATYILAGRYTPLLQGGGGDLGLPVNTSI